MFLKFENCAEETRIMQNRSGNVAIIGTGLLGGAILNELILSWERRKSDIEVINITARSTSTLVSQLQKTKESLKQKGIDVKQDGTLRLSMHRDINHLLVEGELLDIIPKGLSSTNVDDDTFRRFSSLYSYIENKRPKIVIIGVNLASIVSSKELEKIQNIALGWIVTTLKRAADDFDIEIVAIMGTTALGGQGTNMVWSHQSSQEMDINLVNKILAAYGILGLLDRMHSDTNSNTRWILLTPGSLLGYDFIEFGQAKYSSIPKGLPKEVEEIVRNNDLHVPLYKPLEISLAALSDEEASWKERRINDAYLSGIKIKCGESGEFSPLQFACISHAFQMGFNTDAYIARILLDELAGKRTGYNQIPLGSGKVIEPTAQGQNDRNLALKRMSEMEKNKGRSPSVYPALGSPRAQKEIVLADLLYRLLADRFGKPTIQQIANYHPNILADELWKYLKTHPRLFADITSVIPVISPQKQICTGPHVMYLNVGIDKTSNLAKLHDEELFQEFAALGAVDLRPEKEQVMRGYRIYETGIEVNIKRARFILDRYANLSPENIDRAGSAIDPRIRYWNMLTSESHTLFDPVFFVVQFIGGDRPYLQDFERR
jgi:hypothetical protein